METIPAIAYVQRIDSTTTATYVSPAIEPILGWRPDEYTAHPVYWFTRVHPEDQERVRGAVERAIATRQPLNLEYRVTSRSGQVVWLHDAAVLAEERADGVQLWHGVQHDITAAKTNETRLHTMAFYDSLTGLPNRRRVIDHLRAALSASEDPNVAILFLDLDGFKYINDGFGHAGGDELLVAVARRLAAQVAGRGSLSRFGGDEFVAVLENAAERDVRATADALLEAMRSPYYVNGYELNVDGTIGIAISSPELSTPETLLRAADRALYRAKANGRGVFAVYDPRID
jgi:diguanylate cyclase (GGDEF)-like protein/PAS domain S-box-containing protein